MKATKLDPSNHVIFSNLAAALLPINKFKQALAATEKAIELEETFAKSHHRQGQALTGLLREEEAIASFRRAVELDPANTATPTSMRKAAEQCAARCKENKEEAPAWLQHVLQDSAQLQSAADKESEVRAKAKAEEEQKRAKKKAADKKAKEQAAKAKAEADALARAQKLQEARDQAAAKGETFLESEPEAQPSESTAKEMYEATCRMRQGNMQGYDSARIQAFARSEIQGLLDPAMREQYAAAIAVFLPGRAIEGWGDEGSGVAINSAFDSPDTHSQVVTFMRRHAIETDAHAILVIVRKGLVSFPRVWAGKTEWAFGDKDGYFVQLETCNKEDRQLWFMEVGIGGALTQHSIDFEAFKMVGTLLRDVADLPALGSALKVAD